VTIDRPVTLVFNPPISGAPSVKRKSERSNNRSPFGYHKPGWRSVVSDPESALWVLRQIDGLFTRFIAVNQREVSPNLPDFRTIARLFRGPSLEAIRIHMNQQLAHGNGLNPTEKEALSYVSVLLDRNRVLIKKRVKGDPNWLAIPRTLIRAIPLIISDVLKCHITPRTVQAFGGAMRSVSPLLSLATKDTYAWINSRRSYSELVAAAKAGDINALLEVVRINKVTEPWMIERLQSLAAQDDASWHIKQIGQAMTKPAVSSESRSLRVLVMVILFVGLADVNVNVRQIVEFLDELYPAERHSEQALRTLFSAERISLRAMKKPRRNL
jgi:hypothetical protein